MGRTWFPTETCDELLTVPPLHPKDCHRQMVPSFFPTENPLNSGLSLAASSS